MAESNKAEIGSYYLGTQDTTGGNITLIWGTRHNTPETARVAAQTLQARYAATDAALYSHLEPGSATRNVLILKVVGSLPVALPAVELS